MTIKDMINRYKIVFMLIDIIVMSILLWFIILSMFHTLYINLVFASIVLTVFYLILYALIRKTKGED